MQGKYNYTRNHLSCPQGKRLLLHAWNCRGLSWLCLGLIRTVLCRHEVYIGVKEESEEAGFAENFSASACTVESEPLSGVRAPLIQYRLLEARKTCSLSSLSKIQTRKLYILLIYQNFQLSLPTFLLHVDTYFKHSWVTLFFLILENFQSLPLQILLCSLSCILSFGNLFSYLLALLWYFLFFVCFLGEFLNPSFRF